MAGRTTPYRDFTDRIDRDKKNKLNEERETPDRGIGIPRTPGVKPRPGKPAPRQGHVEVDAKKEAIKRRLKRTAAAMKAKSQRRN